MPEIGFITGLASEAACLAPYFPRAYIKVAAMRSDAAERAARELCATGCTALLSFGLAGALSAALAPGTLVIANEIVTPEGERIDCTAEPGARLRSRLPHARSLPIAGSETIVATPLDKIRLNQRTGATVTDMESHRIVRVAHEHGIPFLAVRTIADVSSQIVPLAVRDVTDEFGRPQPFKLLRTLAGRPWEIFAVMRLAAQSRIAHQALRDVAPVLRDIF